MLAALACGGYRWQPSSPTPPAPLDIAQTVAAVEQDLRAENWSEAKRKIQRIIADSKVPAMIKEAVRQKRGATEQNELAQAAFERFKVAAKSSDPDEELNLYWQIPAASFYFSRAAETYSQVLLRFRDVHLQCAQATLPHLPQVVGISQCSTTGYDRRNFHCWFSLKSEPLVFVIP